MGDLKVAFPKPCSEPWEGMAPRGCNRHCASCDKTIYDLSALTLAEAEDLLRDGEEVCVRARVRGGVVELAEPPRNGRRMIAAVGASMAMASAACQTAPPENTFQISGTVPMIQNSKPVVRSSDGQKWHVEMEYRSRVFRVPDLYPGVYSITYDATCGEQFRVMEGIVIRDRSLDLGLLEGEGDCIVVGVIVPADEDLAG